MTQESSKKDSGSIQSVERALSILFMLAEADVPMTVGQVAENLGVHSSTASRLLSTLAQQNVVVQNRSGQPLASHEAGARPRRRRSQASTERWRPEGASTT